MSDGRRRGKKSRNKTGCIRQSLTNDEQGGSDHEESPFLHQRQPGPIPRQRQYSVPIFRSIDNLHVAIPL